MKEDGVGQRVGVRWGCYDKWSLVRGAWCIQGRIAFDRVGGIPHGLMLTACAECVFGDAYKSDAYGHAVAAAPALRTTAQSLAPVCRSVGAWDKWVFRGSERRWWSFVGLYA